MGEKFYTRRIDRKKQESYWREVDGHEIAPLVKLPEVRLFMYWDEDTCFIIERSSGKTFGRGSSYKKARVDMQERLREQAYDRTWIANCIEFNYEYENGILPPDMTVESFKAYVKSVREGKC